MLIHLLRKLFNERSIFSFNRYTSMIENTSTHNLHSSLVLNGSIWWCCVMIFLCSFYWRKMKQKVKSFPEYRLTVMVQRKKQNLSKRTLNKLFFDIQIRIRKPIYIVMQCRAALFPYNAIIRYNYIYRKIESFGKHNFCLWK